MGPPLNIYKYKKRQNVNFKKRRTTNFKREILIIQIVRPKNRFPIYFNNLSRGAVLINIFIIIFYCEFRALLTKFNLTPTEIKLYRKRNFETRFRTIKTERLIFNK